MTAAAITTEEFLSHKNLALIRLSAQSPVMGVKMDEELRPKGYDVSVVYLNTSEADPAISDVKDKVEGAIIAVPRAESKEAIALAEEKGVPVVSKACVLMYAQPVKSVHAFHRGLWKMFGLLQK